MTGHALVLLMLGVMMTIAGLTMLYLAFTGGDEPPGPDDEMFDEY